MKQPGRIQCIHPEGKHAPSIAIDTYALFEKAICHSLKNNSQGLSFSALMDEVQKYIGRQKTSFTGSASWFGITVKNHLEATGMIRVGIIKGKKLNFLA